jgi:hypothetical protein
MTIDEVIARLKELGDQFGYTTEVKFDCPHCLRTTKPEVIVPIKLVALQGKKNEM